jgi:hypothetical protein
MAAKSNLVNGQPRCQASRCGNGAESGWERVMTCESRQLDSLERQAILITTINRAEKILAKPNNHVKIINA